MRSVHPSVPASGSASGLTQNSFTFSFQTLAAVPEKFTKPHERDVSALARDVMQGFSQSPKTLSSRWFYDAHGSELFARIMELPEYYLTAREFEILQAHSDRIAREVVGRLSKRSSLRIVELGAGDGRKTEILLRAFLSRRRRKDISDFVYSPIDISNSALDTLRARLSREMPDVVCEPIEGDNMEAVARLASQVPVDEPIVLLFLGSSIGNFQRAEVVRFLCEVNSRLRPGDFLFLGLDLVKSADRLVPAYSDRRGVTAEFNYNLLDRLNRELGANFDRTKFRHEAVWNPRASAMESWLVSLENQQVEIPACGRIYHFKKWEAVHTETSLKFFRDEITELARASGFTPVEEYTDSDGEFLDALWRVEPVLM